MKDFDEIRSKIVPVLEEYGVKKAVVFGSFAKGNATEKSDVDVCVESGLKGMRFVGMVESLRNALGNRNVDVFDVEHIDDGSRVALEIANTGVAVYERF